MEPTALDYLMIGLLIGLLWGIAEGAKWIERIWQWL